MATVLLANSFFEPISFAKKTYKSKSTKLDAKNAIKQHNNKYINTILRFTTYLQSSKKSTIHCTVVITHTCKI